VDEVKKLSAAQKSARTVPARAGVADKNEAVRVATGRVTARSAITGKYVTKRAAARQPRTTVTEKSGSGKPKRSVTRSATTGKFVVSSPKGGKASATADTAKSSGKLK